MNPTPPPTLESELLTGLYSEEEKAQILGQIEQAASANRLTMDTTAFIPRKRGILFPVAVNVAAALLVVGAWFGGQAYFQTRQQGLQLKTDKLFSTESALLTKVLEDAKAQMAAKNAEIDKIQGDLQKAADEKAALQKSFDQRVAAQSATLRQEMAAALDAEKKRLQAAGYSDVEIAQKLKEFEAQKNAEFNAQLATYRQQAQAEIDQRTQALTALQSKLQSSQAEQERLRKDIETQNKKREADLQTQLTSQAANITQLQQDKDDLNAYFRQVDTAMATVRAAVDATDWTRTQSAVLALRQVLAKASASVSEPVRARAQAESALVAALDTAVANLSDSTSKNEANAQVEALKAQAKKEAALAALQLAETQKTLADTEERWRQALADADALRQNVADLGLQLDTTTTELGDATALASRNQKSADDLTAQAAELSTQVDSLQKSVEDLQPYRVRSETLKTLFAADYTDARDRFLKTFGSTAGQASFPNFDQAWEALQVQARAEGTAQASRKQAFADVLAFTTYLQGKSDAAGAVKEATEKLARTDDDFRQVIDQIQALAGAAAAESKVSTALTQLYGTVAAVAGSKVTLEPLTKVRPQVGDLIEIRRVQGKNYTVLGRGKVTAGTNTKVEIDWTGNTLVPLSGDAAYLVLP